MCLIIVAWQAHPDYPLIVAANRDEYYQRPTLPAQLWDETPGAILAGRDLIAGGTWLGTTKTGRFAAVTNYREGAEHEAPRSRGQLTTDFLQGRHDPMRYAKQIIADGDQYNGFNLITGDINQLVYCSNRQSTIKSLPPGIYSLSNALLDSPWPKSIHVKQALTPFIQNDPTAIDQMIHCLQRREPFPDEVLPDTGIGIERERTLSPPFIASPGYGTRCTTILLRNTKGETQFVEQSYGEDGSPGKCETFLLTNNK
jgi:uncharacterized protein with NRDE domain